MVDLRGHVVSAEDVRVALFLRSLTAAIVGAKTGHSIFGMIRSTLALSGAVAGAISGV
tara:strand:+ start:266 stop:439 length:174 start_codon:yes stop_codon:yes gene_type:complete